MSSCQNCHAEFQIFPEDRAFYAKISVPEPTWCPDCRNMRRLSWRNERVLYLRPCDLCKKQTLSTLSADKPYTVYCRSCWWSDQWDPMSYGMDFDFSKPFFPQFDALLKRVPTIALQMKSNLENSEYCNEVEDIKDSYMAICTFFGERLLYTYWLGWSNDCVDCSFIIRAQFVYACQDLQESYGCQYVYNGANMTDSKFCFDCRSCTNCFMSAGLRHKSYFIRNKPYTKDDYEHEMAKYDFGSHETITKLNQEFENMKRQHPRKYAWVLGSEDCVGDYINQSKDVYWGFDILGQEKGRYVYDGGDAKDCMDCTQAGIESELLYQDQSVGFSHRIWFANRCWRGVECEYIDVCDDGQNLFGCVGLRNKKYCILNKQYTPEEYHKLRGQIVEHMKKTGEYGNFFPVEHSFYAYNETVAQQWYPMTRDEVLAKGWLWQDHLPGKYDPPTLPNEKIPDSIKDVEKSITKELLACTKCKKNYRIVGPEFEFYKKWVIPIPRKCPDCRFYERFALRNPRKLWHRQCMCNIGNQRSEIGYQNTTAHFHGATRCPNEFETPYAPERSETVYCESCYQKEVL